MKHRLFMRMALTVSVLLFSTACGAERTESSEDVQQDAQATAGQFAVSELAEDFRLKPTAYKALAAGKPEDVQYAVTPYSAVCDGSFYVLRQFFTDSGYQCVVESYAAPEFERTEVSLPLTEWEVGELRIAGFDVCEEGMHFLLTADTGSCLIVNTDKNGALTKKIQPEGEYPESSFYAFRCSGEAFFFIRSSASDGTQECIRLDAQGKVCGSFSCDGEKTVGLPARGEDGSLFFPVTDTGKRETTVVSYDAAAASFRECAVLPEAVGQFCGTVGQHFFYTAQENLICWDTSNGSREAVLALAEGNISSLTDTLLLLEAENGDIWLYVGTYEKEYVMTLSETPMETEVGLSMLCEGGADFQSSITRFNQQYPQYRISTEKADADAEGYRTRVLAKLLNGEGPELLYLSDADMQSLAKMGALAGIEEYVTKETLDRLLPGAREYGSCGGELVGLLPDIAGVNTLFAAAETGNGTGWTPEEVMLLAKERDGLEGLFTYPMGDMEVYNVLWTLVGNGIGQSAFLDAEKKESRFAEGNFAAVLEFVKRYTKTGQSGSVDGAARIREGEYLAMSYPINMAYTFFTVLAETDGAGYAIGYPTESGSGNYFTADGILVVNRNAENKEAISAFLEYLLSAENQKEFKKSLSVRTDITDVAVQYQEYDGQGIFVWNGQGMLPKKEDGSTYIEEYNAFMQSCVPAREDSVYFDIIWEEAEGYFDGARNAEDVVSAIDNRIQLLLDED